MKHMKRTFTFLAVALLLLAAPMFAQKPMDQASEKAVQITSGPNITNISPTAATINWTTNSAGANHVRYRIAGSNAQWQSAYHTGGGTNHSLQLTGLQPGKTYEWQILTRDGDLRTAGQFQTPTSGTAPDVNASATTPAAAPPSGGANPSAAKVPLYRAVSTSNGGHLYTTNAGEQSPSAFKPEGVTGYVAISQIEGTNPLYRLVNASGDYTLTTDPNARAAATAQGYRDDGTIGYIANSQVPGTQPLYQVISADSKHHFYTTDAGERQQVLGQGWKDQGIVGYIWTQP
jgi:Repeat of unknown function (DUF5648)/Purple acid Phosphatase, N-terminal domain